jgi:hypothetical protein
MRQEDEFIETDDFGKDVRRCRLQVRMRSCGLLWGFGRSR